MLLVGEELDRDQGEPACLEQPPKLAGRGMQLEETVGDVGVVVEEAGPAGAAVAGGAQELPVLRRQRPEQEFSEPARSVEPVGRAPRARARSSTRAPCRRETAAGA